MTKCLAFWRIIGLFKEGKFHVELPDGTKATGFKGFQEWCGGRSYKQAKREWNTYETLELLGKKLNIEPCAVLSELGLTAKGLEPLVSLRAVKKKGVRGQISFPSDIQEKAINKLLPRLLTRKVKPQEIKEIVQEFKPGARKTYRKQKAEAPAPVIEKERNEVTMDKEHKKILLNSVIEILGIVNSLKFYPSPYAEHIQGIKDLTEKLLDLLEEE